MQNSLHIQSFGQKAAPYKNLSPLRFWQVLLLLVWSFVFSQFGTSLAQVKTDLGLPLGSYFENLIAQTWQQEKTDLWLYQTEESHLPLTEVLPDKIEVEEKKPESNKQKCKAGLKAVGLKHKIEQIGEIVFLQKTLFLALEKQNCTRNHLPLFLLFHSWKSFLCRI
ncbi:hypothetical protein [Hugenholtzia roseola]|uniref:hypothetical protein n=1 Tax=Hugenholtzia roseola TaxID=1002 RepID=UPI0003FAAE2B|nr:hypothetical protein [Hugenholtzia roseola]